MRRVIAVRAAPPHLLAVVFSVIGSGTLLWAAGPPVTDDFNSPSLNTTLWTAINPVGDGSFRITGNRLELSVPAATNHDPAFGGTNSSTRIVQSISNADFVATVKFDSIPDQQYAFEGILVDQDASNYLRFQFGSAGATLHVTASQIMANNETTLADSVIAVPDGTASLWLRVQRSGNTWVETWSSDGTNFNAAATITQALTPADIGPFVGNYHPTASSAPLFTALVDSFVAGPPTGTPPGPGPGTGTNPVSDDFHSTTLNTTLWTYINPLGGSYRLNGTNLLVEVQGGVSHDPLANAGNYSSRVMQSMQNVDFSTEIKFDSVPTEPGTAQGILVQQDATNFLRFEFIGGPGGSTSLFAGTVIGSKPTTILNNIVGVTGGSVWMRIARSGNTWTLSWSPDGAGFQSASSFSQPIAVSAIGPMVENSGDSGRETPDFTTSIDYFFNLASPVTAQDGGSPRISNVTSLPGASSAAITWDTDVNATSRVDYGLTTSYGSTASNEASLTAHSVLLTGLTCAASYSYAVTSVNSTGASRQSPNFTFKTPPCANPSIPISDSFDTMSLNTSVWTWIDPKDNSYLAFNGTTAQITVPANTIHDTWSARGNGSARIVQPVLNTNFDVVARFVSEPVSGTTSQGIVFEQDAFHYLSFDIRSDGTNMSFWAGSRAGTVQNVLLNAPFHGHAPIWLRVTRDGTNWTLSWSGDGNSYAPVGSFQDPLVVASLGLYAANKASTPINTPAFTASVDVFTNVAAPVSNKAAPPPFGRIVIDPDPGTVLVQETMGDLDGDGKPDAVVGFSAPSHGVAWYRAPHSGSLTDKWDRFTITPSGESYEDLIVYDVNGDGAKDVIASIDSAIKWYENPAGHSGNPTTDVWQEHIISSNAPGENNFILKDIDGDGVLDLVTPHTVFMGSGKDFGQGVVYNSAGFRGLALLDIGSGLGAVNFVGTDPNSPFSFVWFENPRESGGNARTGNWIEHVVGTSYPCDDAPSCFGGGSVANLATGDLNGDGRMDLVTVQSEGYPIIPPGGIIWWEAPADRRNGTWVKHTFDPGFDSPHNVWVADIDRNGTLDVIAAQQEQSKERRVAVFLNDGTGNFSMQILSNTGSHNPYLTDINGDGWLDLFSAGHGRFGAPNPIELYINPRGGSQVP
jgi:regulation of enolase protein 1 (concanavalin A-like superfamily)